MARSHARIATSIWEDDDWLDLTGDAQRFYMMLLSQPNLNHAGVIPITIRRWALLCTDQDEARLRVAMGGLESSRFILVDERTEELLVRTLIRNDGVWKQPKVLAVAIGEASSARSAAVRACVAEELGKVDTTSLEAAREGVEALLKELPKRLVNAHVEAPRQAPANGPPEAPAVEGSKGVRVRAGAAPTPATAPFPGLTLPAPGERPLSITQRSKRLTDAYSLVETMCNWSAVNGVVIKAIKAEKYSDDQIHAALLRLAADKRSVTIDSLRTEMDGKPAARGAYQAFTNPDEDTEY
jgi:hypothetical protein